MARSADFLAASRNEKAISWTTTRASSAAGATMLIVRNTQAAWELHIERISVWCSSASEIVIHSPTDSTTALAGGTAVSGVALKRTGSNTTLAEAMENETGLSQGTVVDRDYIVANGKEKYPFDGSLILGNGVSVGVDTVHAADECIVTIWGFFKLVGR